MSQNNFQADTRPSDNEYDFNIPFCPYNVRVGKSLFIQYLRVQGMVNAVSEKCQFYGKNFPDVFA